MPVVTYMCFEVGVGQQSLSDLTKTTSEHRQEYLHKYKHIVHGHRFNGQL